MHGAHLATGAGADQHTVPLSTSVIAARGSVTRHQAAIDRPGQFATGLGERAAITGASTDQWATAGRAGAGLTLLAVSALHTEQLWPLLIPLFICIASLGCIMPNTSACAMSGQGARAGSASALLGCIQVGVAAGAASLVGMLHDGTAMPMAMVISLCGVLAVTIAMSTQRLQRKRALQAQA